MKPMTAERRDGYEPEPIAVKLHAALGVTLMSEGDARKLRDALNAVLGEDGSWVVFGHVDGTPALIECSGEHAARAIFDTMKQNWSEILLARVVVDGRPKSER